MANEALNISGWEKWHDFNAKVMEPLTTWFGDTIAAAPGQTVLDVACGTGLPSIAVARRLQPGGKVIATDISPVMIGAAKRKSAAAGVDNIEHHEMDLAALGFPDASFDAVTCAFGLMFCPDPVKGASELRRVLRPGGRFAFSAWDQLAKCPCFLSVFGVIARFLKLSPPDPRAPGPFRFSPPGEMDSVLRAAGFSDLTIEPRELGFEFESVAQHWDIMSDMAGPLDAAKRTLPESELAALKQAIADELAPYVGRDGRVRVHNTALLAWGRR